MMQRRGLMIAAAFFGFLAVAALAFGAHILEGQGDQRTLRLVNTAANQQIWHALAMLACGAFAATGLVALRLFAAGILIFCGSLYALALGAPAWAGMITPVGGVLLLLGWLSLAVSFVRTKDRSLDPG